MNKSFHRSILALALAPLRASMMHAVSPDAAGGAAETFADAVGASEAPAAVMNGKEMKYFFKTPEIVVKDDEGKEISRSKGEKHPDVTAVLPVPTPEDAINYLAYFGEQEVLNEGTKDEKKVLTSRAKIAAYIMDLLYDAVKDAGKMQINEFLEKNEGDTKARFTPTMFDLSKLTLEYIANLPKGQRGAWAPSEDELKTFCENYTNVLVHEVNYEPKRVKVHCDQIMKGFAKIKADKVAVEKMKQFLTVWASKVTEDTMGEHEAVFSWLNNRADKYLKAEEKNFADAL
jgi:hypothetical protein